MLPLRSAATIWLLGCLKPPKEYATTPFVRQGLAADNSRWYVYALSSLCPLISQDKWAQESNEVFAGF